MPADDGEAGTTISTTTLRRNLATDLGPLVMTGTFTLVAALGAVSAVPGSPRGSKRTETEPSSSFMRSVIAGPMSEPSGIGRPSGYAALIRS